MQSCVFISLSCLPFKGKYISIFQSRSLNFGKISPSARVSDLYFKIILNAMSVS